MGVKTAEALHAYGMARGLSLEPREIVLKVDGDEVYLVSVPLEHRDKYICLTRVVTPCPASRV